MIVVALLLLFGLAQKGSPQSAAAPAAPLNFENNFFVTGDYVVAGAYNMNSKMTNMNGITYAVGTINVPDANPAIKKGNAGNPGITGATAVPAGAQIVAALLYWQTVEKTGVMPGQTGSGQKGFFRSTFYGQNGPQAPGYSLTGVDVTGHNTVSFSSGGCSGGSTGKVVRTYRADVRAYLPQDSSGNVIANGTYEVSLPSTGTTTPITLGATLVIIYRVLSPGVPLNSIVIYDGAFAPTSGSQVMSQAVQGFYQAGNSPLSTNMNSPVSRLTHIVGSGQSNKFQNVYLVDLIHALPNHYPNGLPPFPGWYGSWDNTTWTFGDPKYPEIANPIQEGTATSPTSSATAVIKPATSQQGCVSSAAVILSTTVKNSDKDGILDIWKVPAVPHSSTPGYCDASVSEGQCSGPGDPAWVDLPGATQGHKDVFVQLDYMCSSVTGADSCDTSPVNPNFTNYSFDPRLTGAADMISSAFLGDGVTHPVHVHINPFNPTGTTQPVHAIQEQTCVDGNPSNSPLCAPALQPFPNQPGVVGWKGGFEFLKSQPVNYPDENSCEQALSGPCIRRFQYARKDSYHYAVFAHAIGRANWGLQGGSLANVTAFTNGDIKFTTAAPHGLVVDSQRGNGRVTIADAITNPSLNGTFKVTGVSPPAGVLSITGTSMSVQGIATYTFTKVSGSLPAAGDLVTVQNTTNGKGVFNVDNATIATVAGSTFTVNFHVPGFTPSAIGPQIEAGGCAPGLACAQTNRAPFYFTINITPSTVSTQTAYTALTDPNLTVTSGQASTGSGFSDIGGGDTLVALGLWGDPSKPTTNPPGLTKTVQAGTFMHELGHTLGLTHGGLFYDKLAAGQNPPNYTPTFDANCKSNYQSVMNYMFQADLLGPSGSVLDFSSQQLDSLHENSLLPIALGGSTSAVMFPTTTWYDTTPNLVGSKARHHCDGSPMFFNANVAPFSADATPIMYPHLNQALPTWSGSLDINFDGTIDTSALGFRGYDDWVNIDLRQMGATGSDLTGPGKLGGGPGKLGGGPGRLGGGPGRLGGGPGASLEIDFETANAVTRPPRNLTAMEDRSPRFIHLFWFPPTFGQIGTYNIYRQPPWTPGAPPTFSVPVGDPSLIFHNTPGDPHLGQYEFVDNTATCNPTGYQYFVSAVLANTTQESGPSNTVSTGQNGDLLTACYTPGSPLFASPGAGSSSLAGNPVTVQWSVLDASNRAGTSANNPGSNSLVAIGPISNDTRCVGSGDANTPHSPIAPLGNGNGIVFDGTSQFSFTWRTAHGFNGTAAAFPPGCYRLELDLDSRQPTTGTLPASAFQVQFYLSDMNESVVITPTSVSDATVGIGYGSALSVVSDSGGATAPFSWNVVAGSLPAGFTLDPASGTISGTTLIAGTYNFTVQVTDFIGDFGTQPLTLTVHIFVSDSQPPANPPFTPTTTLPNAVVGSPYTNTVYQSGGVSNNSTAFSWTIVPNSVMPGGGSTLPGISFQPNAVGVTNGTLSGTPTAPGTYTFTAKVTDSAGNTGTQTLTLNVADALFGDLIVVDGSPLANPLAGTLFRVTPAGTSGTIATISTGQPSGVAVDASTGNIYAAVAPVAGSGTPGVTQVTQFGTVNNSFVSGAPLQNPVAVAVDALKNVYVGDNLANAIYKFDSTGKQVGAAFASLPASSVMHVRMAFDPNGNLIVASDSVNGASGVIEVDQFASDGTLTVLYNTTSKSTAAYALTAASAADVNGNTTYTGTFSPTIPANSSVTIAGFTSATNNGTFTVVSCSSTQLVVMNSGGMAETPNNPGSATLQLTAIGTVGGIAVLSDGSIDVADFGAKAIYKITNPGAANMSVTTDISAGTAVNPPPSPLCCNISGMANPAGGANANLFITLTGVNNTKPQLQQAVPATSTVTTVNLIYSLTQASAADVNGDTAYTGTFSPTIAAGSLVTITGFANAANNGTFAVVSCSSTQLVVVNGNGVAESTSATAQTVPLTFPNDVATYSKP